MHLPYVIDNQIHKLADVLNGLLADERTHALDVATAYFNVGGFALLHEWLTRMESFRLLLQSAHLLPDYGVPAYRRMELA